jgi:hypothetical protein
MCIIHIYTTCMYMYIHANTCTYIQTYTHCTHILTYTHCTHVCSLHITCTHTGTHAHTHTNIYIYTDIHTYTYIQSTVGVHTLFAPAHTYRHTHIAHIYRHTHIAHMCAACTSHARIQAHIHTHTQTYTYTQTYTHTHTYSQLWECGRVQFVVLKSVLAC